MTDQYFAFSGGKDSTAMVLEAHRRGERGVLLMTLTGNELPEVTEHINRIVALTGWKHVQPPGPTLDSLIRGKYRGRCLPNWRQRWCTREIKIEPCQKFLESVGPATLCVGLRADEPERVGGKYPESVNVRFPLREWGWNEADVWRVLHEHEITIPWRTNCALCYDQRIGEWRRLWEEYPDLFALGIEYERLTGSTFRGPGRDSWPNSLKDLGDAFARCDRQLGLF